MALYTEALLAVLTGIVTVGVIHHVAWLRRLEKRITRIELTLELTHTKE